MNINFRKGHIKLSIYFYNLAICLACNVQIYKNSSLGILKQKVKIYLLCRIKQLSVPTYLLSSLKNAFIHIYNFNI